MLFKVLFLYILTGHLCEVHVYSSECLPKECLKCSITGANDTCVNCTNTTTPRLYCVIATLNICTRRDFNVSINGSTSVEEAAPLTLTCMHDLPEEFNVTYEWKKDSVKMTAKKRKFSVKQAKLESAGKYICVVHSKCGSYTSEPHEVTVENNSIIILVICGCSALVLIIFMGGCMKFKMHRDKIKNQQRTKERVQEMRRAQDLQNRGPLPNPTPT